MANERKMDILIRTVLYPFKWIFVRHMIVLLCA